MKEKRYSINIKRWDSDEDWDTADKAIWYEDSSEAFAAAREAYAEPDVIEAVAPLS